MITEERPVATKVPGPAPTLEDIERQRKHLWVTAFIALVVVSLAVAVVSYWTQIFPESIRRTVNFSAMRFVFVALSVGFIAYAVERERRFRVLTRELRATLREQRLEPSCDVTVPDQQEIEQCHCGLRTADCGLISDFAAVRSPQSAIPAPRRSRPSRR